MHTIILSEALKDKIPNLKLFCIESEVSLSPTPDALWLRLSDKCSELSAHLKLDEISSLPAIQASRKAYKATGKDPARYRLSAEALIRRAVKDKELYRINNVVDLLNLVSVSTGFSIGGYDAGTISGTIEFGIGEKDEPYEGIGRGPLNIEGLPVFRDQLGAFGSPTSDSDRTSIKDSTTHFLMIIIGFGANHLLDGAGKLAIELLQSYAGAKNMEIQILE
jgi:DNA/RNA-binding domain of Phe-tRNA-synthetase-like protein